MLFNEDPRRTINNLIDNIHQIATDISKDVGGKFSPTRASSQPMQNQVTFQEPLYQSAQVHTRINSKSSKIEPNMYKAKEDNKLQVSSSELNGIAQGIHNAHIKVDEALRFMNDIKHKLEPSNGYDNKNNFSPIYRTSPSFGDIMAPISDEVLKMKHLYDQNNIAHSSNQIYSSLNLRSQHAPLEGLSNIPRTSSTSYFHQPEFPHFNPFARTTTHRSQETRNISVPVSESWRVLGPQKYHSNPNLNIVPNLSLSSNPGFIHDINYQGMNPGKPPLQFSNFFKSGMNPTVNTEPVMRPNLNEYISSPPVNVKTMYDHERLNQILSNIKHRDRTASMNPSFYAYKNPETLTIPNNTITSFHDPATKISQLNSSPIHERIRQSMASSIVRTPSRNNGYNSLTQSESQFMSPPLHTRNNTQNKTNEDIQKMALSTFIESSSKPNMIARYSKNRYIRNKTENNNEGLFGVFKLQHLKDILLGEQPMRIQTSPPYYETRGDSKKKRVGSQEKSPDRDRDRGMQILIGNERKSPLLKEKQAIGTEIERKLMEPVPKGKRKNNEPKARNEEILHEGNVCRRIIVENDSINNTPIRNAKKIFTSPCGELENDLSRSEAQSDESVEYLAIHNTKTITHRISEERTQICPNCKTNQLVKVDCRQDTDLSERSYKKAHPKKVKSPKEGNSLALGEKQGKYHVEPLEEKKKARPKKNLLENNKTPSILENFEKPNIKEIISAVGKYQQKHQVVPLKEKIEYQTKTNMHGNHKAHSILENFERVNVKENDSESDSQIISIVERFDKEKHKVNSGSSLLEKGYHSHQFSFQKEQTQIPEKLPNGSKKVANSIFIKDFENRLPTNEGHKVEKKKDTTAAQITKGKGVKKTEIMWSRNNKVKKLAF